MSGQSEIEYREEQDVDVGVVVLCGIFMLLFFNIICVCIFYRKWKKRQNKFRLEYIRYGRSEYLRRHRAQPIRISFKYIPDWFQRNWNNRFGIQSMRNKRRQHRPHLSKLMQPNLSTTKGFRNQKTSNSLQSEQRKRHPRKTKIIVKDGLLSNRINLFKEGVTKDGTMDEKTILNTESSQNRESKGLSDTNNKHSIIDIKQIRPSTGRSSNQCPSKVSEVQIHKEKAAGDACYKRATNSVKQSMDACPEKTSNSKIETLSTLFLIHSDDVSNVLSRMGHKNQTK
ncbi:uncharacterized protein LOC134283572 [Saccostrea cucullata]|uniref:uncharacterized protein LOC134283572 n=1 Tax=Saccostrea cuccullata TaxID=36930 RepID=UPI002ED1D672